MISRITMQTTPIPMRIKPVLASPLRNVSNPSVTRSMPIPISPAFVRASVLFSSLMDGFTSVKGLWLSLLISVDRNVLQNL